jgi:hypothetical protein
VSETCWRSLRSQRLKAAIPSGCLSKSGGVEATHCSCIARDSIHFRMDSSIATIASATAKLCSVNTRVVT